MDIPKSLNFSRPYIHLIEPVWNFSRIEQVMHRAVRIHPHTIFDDVKDEKNIKVIPLSRRK